MHFLTRAAITGIAALLIAPGAYAQQPTTFSAFSLDHLVQDTSRTEPILPLKVLSDADGVTRIGLDTLEHLGPALSGGLLINRWYRLSMQLAALPGYQITGFEFSSDLAGVLRPSAPPANAIPKGQSPGTANNYARAALAVSGLDGVTYASSMLRQDDVTGAGQLGLNGAASAFPDVMTLSMDAFLFASASYGRYHDKDGNELKVPSFASIAISNPVLTIYSAALPVPEPGTWMMLLAGLGLMTAWHARRSKAGKHRA
ncbi:PEP-CTERM sorting domain-containing protein [Janthinobacterium agaricidamnosum]|uniref:PEP-CTERM putative exosortase interaction domain protein n=1 Tax=Janthinobacterium agaricidamnosum NBRC 102515 = DSM 9628 TaxID=1349767 RepID=W0UYA3_9BURK|nr:PEP-CTERM sorting domain-containing protein [Janthinobacterium agaricidamnosum]CDG81534.1 PEP-CTERM putative exosortase interaction domain protein [Janthinobacterium agaricidamnosum NBRC 102515 = DSM 9628]